MSSSTDFLKFTVAVSQSTPFHSVSTGFSASKSFKRALTSEKLSYEYPTDVTVTVTNSAGSVDSLQSRHGTLTQALATVESATSTSTSEVDLQLVHVTFNDGKIKFQNMLETTFNEDTRRSLVDALQLYVDEFTTMHQAFAMAYLEASEKTNDFLSHYYESGLASLAFKEAYQHKFLQSALLEQAQAQCAELQKQLAHAQKQFEDELNSRTKSDVRIKYERAVLNELRAELRRQVLTEVDTLTEQVKDELRANTNLQDSVREELCEKMAPSVLDELRENVSLRDQVYSELMAELQPAVTKQVEATIRDEQSTKVYLELQEDQEFVKTVRDDLRQELYENEYEDIKYEMMQKARAVVADEVASLVRRAL